jgi:predicted metal-dependent peptidase
MEQFIVNYLKQMERFYPLFEEFLAEAKKEEMPDIPKSAKLEDSGYVYAQDGTKIDMAHLKREMESAKTAIVSQSPLFAPYVHNFVPIYTWLVPTMATDGARLFVNPLFANKLEWVEKIFVIIHEIMHCVLLHMERMKTRDAMVAGPDGQTSSLFNIAADFEINAIIIDTLNDFDEAFIKKIHGLYDVKYLNQPVEQIYDELKKNIPTMPPNPNKNGNKGDKNDKGDKGDKGDKNDNGGDKSQPGQGQGGKPEEGEGSQGGTGGTGMDNYDEIYKQLGGYDPAGTGGIITPEMGKKIAKESGYGEGEIGPDENPIDKWRVEGAKMLDRAEKSQKGSGKGKGSALVNALYRLHRGDVNWQNLFRRYVATALSPETYQKLGNKKHLSGEFLRYGEKHKQDAMENIVVAVDVSGSMGQDALNKILNEINQIIFSKRVNKVTILFFDDGVDDKSVQTIKKMGHPYIPKGVSGGGGTNFQKVLDWVHEHLKDRISLMTFFTDGGAAMPKKPSYAHKFIWLVYDNPGFQHPFGKQINLG